MITLTELIGERLSKGLVVCLLPRHWPAARTCERAAEQAYRSAARQVLRFEPFRPTCYFLPAQTSSGTGSYRCGHSLSAGSGTTGGTAPLTGCPAGTLFGCTGISWKVQV